MSEFLLDVYSEEILSSVQLLAKRNEKVFEDSLKKENINFSLIEIFFYAKKNYCYHKWNKNVNKLVKEIRGPSTSVDQKVKQRFY